MSHQLFLEKKRHYEGPQTYMEEDFEYLDRSSRPEAEKVRSFLNTWIARFPLAEAKELISRIQSQDRSAFESATFEIILFSLIRSLGWSAEIHPNTDNESGKKPDFLVTIDEGKYFYLEAVLASEFNEAKMAADKRKNVVLDALSKLECSNFFLGINAEGDPTTPPSAEVARQICTVR